MFKKRDREFANSLPVPDASDLHTAVSEIDARNAEPEPTPRVDISNANKDLFRVEAPMLRCGKCSIEQKQTAEIE